MPATASQFPASLNSLPGVSSSLHPGDASRSSFSENRTVRASRYEQHGHQLTTYHHVTSNRWHPSFPTRDLVWTRESASWSKRLPNSSGREVPKTTKNEDLPSLVSGSLRKVCSEPKILSMITFFCNTENMENGEIKCGTFRLWKNAMEPWEDATKKVSRAVQKRNYSRFPSTRKKTGEYIFKYIFNTLGIPRTF